tara:strand:+ start:287 stop:484 length:198 start_codon:yes stop_codon:yes gene_type:complete
MKIGDLVQIDVTPTDKYADPVPPAQRGIIIAINPCEYMPSYRIYRLINGSTVWMYDINVRLLNPA